MGLDERRPDKAFGAEAEKTCYTPPGYEWTSTPFQGTLSNSLGLTPVRHNLAGQDASEGHNVSHHKALIGMEDKQFIRSEKVAFLALTCVKGVGFWTLHKVAQSGIGYKGSLKDPESIGLGKAFRDADFEGFEGQERLWAMGLGLARQLAAAGVNVVFKDEASFPPKLREIPDAPEWLFIQGKADNLGRKAVAIVGTRKPSPDGLFLTKLVVATLANTGMATVSGLALGIDQVAHSESIRFGLPTIAVLGTGIFNDYPKGSESLRSEILNAGGTIVSEYLPHQSYSAENFVRRNRIQAALGDILVPAEWQIKSGTAHTVRFASKYGRLIYNVCLPDTRNSKPEFDFALEEYGARTLELPLDIYVLLNSCKEIPAQHHNSNSGNVEISLPLATSSQEQKDASTEAGQADLNLKQLPLL